MRVRLTRDLTRALKRGDPWIFSDALARVPKVPPGTHVTVEDRRGKPVARGFVDPASPLAVRVCEPRPNARLDESWARARLEAAAALRRAVVARPHTTGYRLVNGEGDGLPGLTCDVYGRAAVVVLDGAGAAGFWDAQGVAQAVTDATGVETVYLRERRRGGPAGRPLVGPAPEAPVPFVEHGVRFTADLQRGQKTGFFLDQRETRARVEALSAGRRVLNTFAYTGGFSVYAGRGGAETVTTVDLAKPAVQAADAHWRDNGLDPARHELAAEDAFAFLDAAVEARRAWDLVILDPPSFAPSRAAVDKARQAYVRLIAAGARVTEPGGLLLAASCSSHIGHADFLRLCEEGVGRGRRRAATLEIAGQPADHPAPLPLDRFRYLKVVLMRIAA